MSNPLLSDGSNNDNSDGEVVVGNAAPILLDKFHSILEFWESMDLKAKRREEAKERNLSIRFVEEDAILELWEARDMKAKKDWRNEKERIFRLEDDALKIKEAEDALAAAKRAKKRFMEYRGDSSIDTASSSIEESVIRRKTTETPQRSRNATDLITKESEENLDTVTGGLPVCAFSMVEDAIPYGPKERQAMKNNRAKKWKERIAKKKKKKESSNNLTYEFEVQERIIDNNAPNHTLNPPLKSTIEEVERVPAFPEEEIVFHEGDAARETGLSFDESTSHDLTFTAPTEQISQSLSMSLIDTSSVHSTSTVSAKPSSSASFSSFSHSSPARSRKREIENWVHRHQSQSQTPSSVCTASTISSTSIESNLPPRGESLLVSAEMSVDQFEEEGTGYAKHQQRKRDTIDYRSSGFGQSRFENCDDDEILFSCAQLSKGKIMIPFSERTDVEKPAKEETFRDTHDQLSMGHHVQYIEEELAFLEKEMYQLQEDLNVSQQIAMNWQQEAGLQTQRNERLEQELQKVMDECVKPAQCNTQQQLPEKTEEWKATNENLRRELANTQRHLECLKFAYENIRGMHDMDLDIAGDQLTLLSNKVQEQSATIARLTKENDQLKKKRLHFPSVVSFRDDNEGSDNNSERSSQSQSRSMSSLSSVRNLHEESTFADNQARVEILEIEESSVAANISAHEEEKQSSLRLESAYLERLVEISKTQIEELETALENQQTASSHQMQQVEADAIKSKEAVVLLKEYIVRLETESEAEVSHLRKQIEAKKCEFEEEKERLLDRIIDLESNSMQSTAATISIDGADESSQCESHHFHPLASGCDGMTIKNSNVAEGVCTAARTQDDDEIGILKSAYENLQISLRDVEDDNECLRDRIVDLEDETRTKGRHWENENECLRDRIVDLEKKIRDKEELLETLAVEANLY